MPTSKFNFCKNKQSTGFNFCKKGFAFTQYMNECKDIKI